MAGPGTRGRPAGPVSGPSCPPAAPSSLRAAIGACAEREPRAVAIAAPGRVPLTYAALIAQVDAAVVALRGLGVRPHDRVALALPPGPELAVAVVAVACASAAAPLDPGLRAGEYRTRLTALSPRALVVPLGEQSPSRQVAAELDIAVIELESQPGAPAGVFTLGAASAADRGRAGSVGAPPDLDAPALAAPDEVALILPTSGTTARPRMVPLTHANVVSSARAMAASLHLRPADRCLDMMPLFHIHGLMAAISSLAVGASVAVTPRFDADRVLAWMEELGPTWYSASPPIHQAVAFQASRTPPRVRLRFVRSCSAPLPPSLAAELEQRLDTVVLEAYGMTEASHQVAVNPFPPRARKAGSVGLPAGVEVAIADAEGRRLAVNESGEIVIRGPGVTAGYADDPHASADALRGGWLRTGDIGHLDPDGYLVVTGRLKEMINRGGEKIAPREVDEILGEHPAVARAVTFAVPHATLGEDVAAAVVLREPLAAGAHDLRAFVASRLADFKVPGRIWIVDEVPMTASGKPQRAALAERLLGRRDPVSPAGASSDDPPRTPAERAVAAVWSEVLGRGPLSRDVNFLDLGGNSIHAAQSASRLTEMAGVVISLRDVFDWPTVAALAARVEARQAAALPWPAAGRDLPERLAIPRRDPAQPCPLSLLQESLWTLHQMEPGMVAYNVPRAVRLRGALDATVLRRALGAVVARHGALRTTFATADPEAVQRVRPAGPFSMPVADLGSRPEDVREAELSRCLAAEAARTFDLTADPMLRALLVRLSDTDHVLVLTTHHLASDGWSARVLARELSVVYTAYRDGREPALPPLPIQYVDYAAWQREWLAGGRREELLAYWRGRLQGVPPALDVPADRPRPRVQTYRGARRGMRVTPALADELRALSRREQVTLFMTLLVAFTTLLCRQTGQDDVVVGTATAGRTRVESEGLIGLFVNTLPLRTDLSGDPSFRQLLGRVRETCLGAYAHQDLPFGVLVDGLRPARDLSRPPLFQVMFVFQGEPEPVLSIPGLTAVPEPVHAGGAKFDLTLELAESGGGLCGWIEYNTDLFDEETIARLAGHLEVLLAGIAADPDRPVSRLPVLTAEERRRILVEWSGAEAEDLDARCLHEIFEAQARQSPESVALVHGTERVTYAELNRRANRLAHFLERRGVCAGERVGLLHDRSIDTVAAMLAAMKLGAAFLPLDPRYPHPRIAFMLGDARPAVVVTRQSFEPLLRGGHGDVVLLDAERRTIAEESDENLASRVSAEQAAYIIYTSGSTGRPNGVVGRHRGMVNVLAWLWDDHPFASGDLCCQKTSAGFVDSVLEIFAPLLRGVPSLIVADEDAQDPRRLLDTLAAAQVTRIVLVPSLLEALLDEIDGRRRRLPALTLWLVSGEALSPGLAERFLRLMPGATLVNLYGASEASAVSMAWKVRARPAAGPVPIGRPIRNTRAYVLDRHGQPVPVGVEGELYVGGAGLAAGYLERPELTAKRFVPDTWGTRPGGRLYRTGDRVRYRRDGAVEYLGRVDQQVKLRGVRIEPAEIEAALRNQPGVRDAAATVRDAGTENARLVAYVVWDGPAAAAGDLRHALRSRLPDYMVPSAFVPVEALPLTPSGKVDRGALPPPPATRAECGQGLVAPTHALELQLAQLWESLLALSPIGITDDFFELGGHSLLAVRMLHDTERVCGKRLALTAFFEDATIKHLADLIARQRVAEVRSLVTLVHDGSRPPFVFLHGDYTGGGFYCRELSRALGPDQPFYALHPHGLDGQAPLSSIEAMADDHLRALRRILPRGPYFLGGHCNGGLVAFEMARRLREAGEPVPLLVLIEASTTGAGPRAAWRRLRREGLRLARTWRYYLGRLDQVRHSGRGERSRLIRRAIGSRLATVWRRLLPGGPATPGAPSQAAVDLREVYARAVRRYVPGRYDSPIVVFRATESGAVRRPDLGWKDVADRVEVREARGAHLTMITWHVAALGEELRVCLAKAQEPWIAAP